MNQYICVIFVFTYSKRCLKIGISSSCDILRTLGARICQQDTRCKIRCTHVNDDRFNIHIHSYSHFFAFAWLHLLPRFDMRCRCALCSTMTSLVKLKTTSIGRPWGENENDSRWDRFVEIGWYRNIWIIQFCTKTLRHLRPLWCHMVSLYFQIYQVLNSP